MCMQPVFFCDLITLINFLHADVWNNPDIRDRKVAENSGHPRFKLGTNTKGKRLVDHILFKH